MKIAFSLLVFFALLPLAGRAQTTPDSVVRYQRVVPVAGATADDLYARARQWVALTFEDVHQVLQLEDPQRHILLGSGYTRRQERRPNGKVDVGAGIWFRFRLETRAGRYRIEFTDFASVERFGRAQYAGEDIAFWLASSHATQLASSRHGIDLTANEKGTDDPRIKVELDKLVQPLLASLQQTLTAAPAAW